MFRICAPSHSCRCMRAKIRTCIWHLFCSIKITHNFTLVYFCHYHHRFILLNRCVVLRVVSCLGQACLRPSATHLLRFAVMASFIFAAIVVGIQFAVLFAYDNNPSAHPPLPHIPSLLIFPIHHPRCYYVGIQFAVLYAYDNPSAHPPLPHIPSLLVFPTHHPQCY